MQIITNNLIHMDKDIKSKDELFDYIAELFASQGYVKNARKYKKALYTREQEAPTGIGNMCAIPHGISNTVIEPGVCFIRLKDEIDYPEINLETGKVKYVFGLAIPQSNTSNHVKVLSTIACLLMDESFQNLIATSSESDEILQTINQQLKEKGLLKGE